jgi:hypothetical protein
VEADKKITSFQVDVIHRITLSDSAIQVSESSPFIAIYHFEEELALVPVKASIGRYFIKPVSLLPSPASSPDPRQWTLVPIYPRRACRAV